MFRLKAVIEAADALADGSRAPMFSTYGLCTNLSAAVNTDCEHLVLVVAQYWPEFSGDAECPVPHPKLSPCDGYRRGLYDGQWSGEYGATRRRLAKFIADWIRKNPLRAEQILQWG